MAGLNLFDFTDHLLAGSMKVLAARHELLSANIANADTPGYRPRDIDFAAVMRAVMRSENRSPAYPLPRMIRASGARLPVADPVSMPGRGAIETVADPSFLFRSLTGSYEGEGKLDRNSVDLDREISLLMENSLLYEQSLALLSRKFDELRYAISEGKR